MAIVDDDSGVRNAMTNLLSAFGYSTYTYDSGAAFLRTAADSKASCLVVDIQLGDISGVELGRQLAEAGYTFPIIFMTAHDSETIRRQATELGCVAYLRKPFAADLLIEAIVKSIG